MSFTGQLGTSNSQLGNIELGDAGSNSNLVSVSDTVAVTDSCAVSVKQVVAASDTVAVTDSTVVTAQQVVSVSDTISVTDSLHSSYFANVSDTISISDQVSTGDVHVVHVSDTITVSDSTGGGTAYFANVADAMAISDARTGIATHVLPLGDTLGASDACTRHYHTSVPLSDTVGVSDAVTEHWAFKVSASDTIAVSATSTEVHHPSTPQFVSDTVATSDSAFVNSAFAFRNAADSLSLSDSLSVVVNDFAAVSTGSSLTVGFPQGIRIEGVSDTERYRLDALDGGVPTMALTATPLRATLGSGSNGTILGSGTLSNQFSLGSTSVAVGNYIKITGRWQVVTARVVSTPSLGIAILDANLMVDDPNNGALSWVLLSAVSGVSLTLNEPTNGKTYRLTMSELFSLSGATFTASVQWVASVPNPSVVAAEYFNNGNILLTFSDELSANTDLLDPSVYSLSGGPIPASVTRVRTASATQVILSTTILGTGTYTVNVDQP